MKWKTEFAKILKEEYQILRDKNPRYSQRAFAKKLQISSGALSQIMNGNFDWNLTLDRAVALIEHLDLPKAKKLKALTVIGQNPQRNWKQLESSEYDLLLDETVLAIITCHELAEPERTPEKIGERLGVHPLEVERLISILEKRGYLVKNETSGVIETPKEFWKVGDGPSSEEVRKFHSKNMLQASEVVDLVPADERRYSSLTFVGSRKQLEAANNEIKLCYERIMNIMNAEDSSNEVFRFSTCLFPVRDFSKKARV